MVAPTGIPPAGIAAAPAAQSKRDAPAPASKAAAWLITAAAPGREHTSIDPTAAGPVWPARPSGVVTLPVVSFCVLRITQPVATVTLIVPAFPCSVNSMVTLEPGAIQTLPKPASLSVAPTPSGVSITAPFGTLAPVTA